MSAQRSGDPMPFYVAPFVAPQGTGSNGRRWAMIALPREAWRPIPGGCCCRYCTNSRKTNNTSSAFWDCWAFDLEAVIEGTDARATYCHAPELHGAPELRSIEA